MSIFGDILGFGGSVLGGIFGSKKPKVSPESIAKQIEGQALGARQAGEKYGFNPLALLGLPVDVGAASSNPAAFGRGIAEAALIASDGISRRAADKGRVVQLERLLKVAQDKVNRLTIRPKVPGVYERARNAPSVATADPAARGAGTVLDSRHRTAIAALPRERLDALPPSSSDTSSQPSREPLYVLGGLPIYPMSGFSDAQAFADRYGEDGGLFPSVGAMAGWAQLYTDLAFNGGYYLRRFTDRKGWSEPGRNYLKRKPAQPRPYSRAEQLSLPNSTRRERYAFPF